MSTLLEESSRTQILERIDQLSPNAIRLWGKMPLEKMLTHTAAQLQVALGDLPVKYVGNWFLRHVARRIAVSRFNFPKNVKTDPQLLQGTPKEIETEKAALKSLIGRFGMGKNFRPHSAFGNLTDREWGILAYKHLDHHLRQFGG